MVHCINKLLGWLLHWMVDDPWIIHGNPWIHCISELLGWLLYCIKKLLGWLLHWMSDDPWITMDNPWIHCISELLGWLLHWMVMTMDNPWIHCIPELLCQGPGLEPSYSAILGLFIHSHSTCDGTCYLQPSMDSPRLA